MSKAKFIEISKGLGNQKSLIVKTNNFKWYLYWQNINGKFWASIERLSKHDKEQTKTYTNNTAFFTAVMNIARNKNLQITDSQDFYGLLVK